WLQTRGREKLKGSSSLRGPVIAGRNGSAFLKLPMISHVQSSRGPCTKCLHIRTKRISMAIQKIAIRLSSTDYSSESKIYALIGCAMFDFSSWGTKFHGMKIIP